MTFTNWLRIIEALLGLVALRSMWLVTWRLAPDMKPDELTARQGVTFTFLAIAEGLLEGVANSAPFGPRLVLLLAGLAASAYGFTHWAHRLPRRKPRSIRAWYRERTGRA